MFERFTDEARQAVERAQHEARALGHNYLGTEHLLVGLCLEDTAAGRALAVAGVTREAVLADVRRSVGEGRSPGPVRPDSESLASVGIDLDEVRRRAEQAFGTGALERTSAWRRQALSCITRRARKALTLALREALRLGHPSGRLGARPARPGPDGGRPGRRDPGSPSRLAGSGPLCPPPRAASPGLKQSCVVGEAVSPDEMCWQVEAWRDFDRVRAQLREDLRSTRDRRVRPAVRVGAWVGLAGVATALGEPLLALPAVGLFEAFVVPRLGSKPPPSIGPLRPWHPPDSYQESPEAPAPWTLRRS